MEVHNHTHSLPMRHAGNGAFVVGIVLNLASVVVEAIAGVVSHSMSFTDNGRGLASADQETKERVASMGGQAAHEQGTAHEWDNNEAREAGRKGGKSVSQDKEHMSEIGSKSGENSHGGGRNNHICQTVSVWNFQALTVCKS